MKSITRGQSIRLLHLAIALTMLLSFAFVSVLAIPAEGATSTTQINENSTNASLNPTGLGDSPDQGLVVYYFWAIGCGHCAALEPYMESVIAKYPQVTFLKLEISHNTTNYYLFKDFNAAFNIPGETTPSAFIENELAMIGDVVIRDVIEPNIDRLLSASTPTAPQNLAANAGNGNVVLTWSTPADNGGAAIAGYKVYRGTSSGGETLIVTLGNVLTMTINGLTNGVTNYYKVSAVNSKGEGPFSNEVSATPMTLPGAPNLRSATPSDSQVVLTWSAPTSNGGGVITNYNVYRGLTSGSMTLLTTVGNVLTYIDGGLTNGQAYYYTVRAVNVVGEGPQSNQLSVIPLAPPTTPQNLAANAGNGNVVLTWSTPADNGGAAITGYKVYRGTSSGGQGITPIATLGNVLTYTNTGLTNGATYYYKVSAVNSKGEGVSCIEVSATPIGSPTAIQNLQTNPGDAYINLTWHAPASNGGSPITNYQVWRGASSGTETFLTNVYPNLWFKDTGLTNGQTYYYLIKAENAVGLGPSSNEVSARPSPQQTVPDAPRSPTAMAGNGQIVLAWSVPASNGGATVTNYTVYRGTTAGGETLLITLGNTLTYTDKGLANFQTYYYKVSAVNSVGEGPKSNEFNAIPGTAPTIPQNLQAILGDTYINLTWQAPASNGGSAITNYKVWRGTTSGTEIFLTSVYPSLWFNDTGLTNGEIYYYKVSAVNSVGEGPKSNEFNGAPCTVPTAPLNLQTILGNGYIRLTWEAPIDDGGSAITNYQVWRGTSSGTETFLTDADLSLWLNDTGLTNGQAYYYKVWAENSKGVGLNSSEISVTPSELAIAPSSPLNFVVTAGNGWVSLSWGAPSSNGSHTLLGYRIYRVTGNDSMTLIGTQPSTTFTDTNLTNGQIYYYQVCAYNAAGNGTMTDMLHSTPRSGFSTDLTLGMVVGAAIIDSINPCAISVLIFLLMFLTSLGNRRRVLLVGIAYIVTVFLVYLIAGIGLLTFLQSTSMTLYVYYAAAVLSIAIGAINIKDYVFPGDKPTVAIPESRKPLIKKYIEKASVPAAVGLGAMVSLFELPCTGGIYLAILSLVGNNMTLDQGMPYLVLYNLIFVLPLAIILVLIYFGVSAKKANEWRLEKRSKLRLVIGVVMLVLGAGMLVSVI
jgi:cytochrome c biogenesis protein CcdA/fibronectin type 3 domain-containing protein